MKKAYADKIIPLVDNFFGHLADYERFMCVILHLRGTMTEIFKLRFFSLVRTHAVFVPVICGAEPEMSVSSAFMEVKLLAM